jgi:Tol biopolymer transport system component
MMRMKICIFLILIILSLAGCAPGAGSSATSEPTMTAIPLPTYTPTQVAARVEPSLSTSLPSTATPPPTASPTPTPEATASTEPTVTSPPPTPTPEPAATATAKPKAARPKPTATPEFTGRLVFQTTLGGDLYTINADGSDLQRITDGMDPAWSPDGQQIAFTRWREPRGVWVVDVTTGDERRVFDWSEARWPSWSPDGEQIVFSRHTGGTSGREFCFRGRCFSIPARDFWNLGVVNPSDGSFAEPLPNSDVSQSPDWSPDGERIVYDAVQGLQVQSVDGTISYPLTDDARDTSPIWSPDGEQIVFTRRQHDHWEIYVVDADGRNLTRLTNTPLQPDGMPGNGASPTWSPSGEYVAYLTDQTGTWEIWVMRTDGSNPRPMFRSSPGNLTLEYTFLAERALAWTR